MNIFHPTINALQRYTVLHGHISLHKYSTAKIHRTPWTYFTPHIYITAKIHNLMKSWMENSLDSSMRPVIWFMIYQPDEVLDGSLDSSVRSVTWFMIYQPDEVLDGSLDSSVRPVTRFMMSCRNIVHQPDGVLDSSLDSSVRPVTRFMMSCRNIVHQPDGVLDSSLDSSIRSVTWFTIYQLDEAWTAHWIAQWDQSHGLWFTNLMKSWTGDSLDNSIRSVTWFMVYQPDEVLDGGFVGQLDEISHMVYDEPGHVFCITQVLALQCTAHNGLLGLPSVWMLHNSKWEQVSSPHRHLLSLWVPTYWTERSICDEPKALSLLTLVGQPRTMDEEAAVWSLFILTRQQQLPNRGLAILFGQMKLWMKIQQFCLVLNLTSKVGWWWWGVGYLLYTLLLSTSQWRRWRNHTFFLLRKRNNTSAQKGHSFLFLSKQNQHFFTKRPQ